MSNEPAPQAKAQAKAEAPTPAELLRIEEFNASRAAKLLASDDQKKADLRAEVEEETWQLALYYSELRSGGVPADESKRLTRRRQAYIYGWIEGEE